jgi:diguanylate cyclase (GGDEF)-like protein/PAS domain S-box-containing protein
MPATVDRRLQTGIRHLRDWLPTGGTLTDAAWRRRHQVIVALLWLHAAGIALFGLLAGYGIPHSGAEATFVAMFGIPASAVALGRRLRSTAATLGLMTASALLVHLSNGAIEAHFHFFVMLAVVALYQDWLPFLLGIGYVVVEHGTLGVLLPHEVFNHPDAWGEPWKWALIHGMFVLGLCAALVAQWRLAELTQAERRRAAMTQARLAAIVTSSDDAIMGTDLRGIVMSWNSGAERLFGYARAEMVGQQLREKLVPDEWRHQVLQARDHLLLGEAAQSHELSCRRNDGSIVEVGISVSPLRDETGTMVGYSCIARDITELKRTEDALRHRALHDLLTGLPNRVLLHERVRQHTTLARSDDNGMALMVIDLNGFKEINDTFGHHYGDALLTQVGQRWLAVLRQGDTLARLGGDEFALLLPSTGDAEGASLVALRLQQALEDAFVLDDQRVHVSASIGLAVFPEHGRDAETLLRCADVAMYSAKRSGRGCAIYDAGQDHNSAERIAMAGELRQALAGDEFVLHFQPLVNVETGRVVGAEALVRWQHPRRGLLAPDQFIPLAERTALIEPLDQWVLNAALQECRAWQATGFEVAVAVNLSTRSLQNPALPGLVSELLERAGVAPGYLHLEITETSVMADPAQTIEVLSQLRAKGMRVAVDDFGTGYASLAYLKRLPVDELKIDKSFVAGVSTDSKDLAIVRSTIGLGHELGLEVVAEGVEDGATWELLASAGCDLVQGYYISRPVASAAFRDQLRRTNRETDTALQAA